MHLDLFISLRSRCFLNNVLCSCIKCDLSWLHDNMEIKHRILSIGNRYPVCLACKKRRSLSANEAKSGRGARGTSYLATGERCASLAIAPKRFSS